MNRIILHIGIACAFFAGCASLGKQRRSDIRGLRVSIAHAVMSSTEDCVRLKVRIANKSASPIYLLKSDALPVITARAPQHARPYLHLTYAIFEYQRFTLHAPSFILMEIRSSGEAVLSIDIPLPLQDRYKSIHPGAFEELGIEPLKPRGSHTESILPPVFIRVSVGAIPAHKLNDSYRSTGVISTWALDLQGIVESEDVYISETSSPHRHFSCRDVVSGGGRRLVFTEWEFR